MSESKKTVVIGASTNPARYSFRCIHQLMANGHEVVPIGIKNGEVNGVEIIKELKPIEDVDTVTLYVGPSNQPEYYDYILNVLKPKRLIFNPGTENKELKDKAIAKGIDAFEACTLVMMSTNQF
ncbi:CoA-binding protein [bacterium]|nr:CoA-binding protein [bacterium]